METKCILAKGALDTHGYGRVKIGGRTYPAHRVAWQNEHGAIPLGFQLDHLCRNRACINVKHLEMVTAKENVLRGNGLAAKNSRKTHCKRGHELSGKNLRSYDGKRVCRACKAWHQRNVNAGRGK